MPPTAGVDYWNEEGSRYRRPHARLRLAAKWLGSLPQRRVLDVGCSGAALKHLLPADFAYFGCDITDDAAGQLPSDHFLQCDLNRARDLSFFAGKGIDAVHIGGVLEYLREPRHVLAEVRRLVPAHAPLVVSMINFDARYYAKDTNHHPGWVYKPRLDDFVALLHASGWQVHQIRPFLGRGELTNAWFRLWGRALGSDHPWTRQIALQFVVLAHAV